jgi:MFS family permease
MALASVAAAVAGRLATGLGTGKMAALGLGGVAAGLLLMMGASREGGLLAVRAGTVVGEAGFTFSNVSPTIAGTGATGGDGRGLAAGLLNTSFQLGNAWGLGVVATLVAATAGPGALAGGLGAGLLACTGFALLAMPIAFFGLPGENFFRPPTMESSKRAAGGGTAAAVRRGYRAAAPFRPEGPTPPVCRTRPPPASRR